eukprot:1168522-Amphidinium_carterae.1
MTTTLRGGRSRQKRQYFASRCTDSPLEIIPPQTYPLPLQEEAKQRSAPRPRYLIGRQVYKAFPLQLSVLAWIGSEA